MNETLQSNEIILKPGQLSLISCGYEDPNDPMACFERDAGAIAYVIKDTMNPFQDLQLLNAACTKNNILEALQSVSALSTLSDTLIFYYSGHGDPDALDLPDYQKKRLTKYPKQHFFDAVKLFPGRKIMLMNCCNGDYPLLPTNTLLVCPSKDSGGSIGGIFYLDILYLISSVKKTEHPFNEFVQTLLREFHNRPYGPNNAIWEQSADDPLDRDVYKQEKTLGLCLLPGYQRAGDAQH